MIRASSMMTDAQETSFTSDPEIKAHVCDVVRLDSYNLLVLLSAWIQLLPLPGTGYARWVASLVSFCAGSYRYDPFLLDPQLAVSLALHKLPENMHASGGLQNSSSVAVVRSSPNRLVGMPPVGSS
jgi:hypothetical protein